MTQLPTPTPSRAAPTELRSAGRRGVGDAVGRAILSQFHPKMLFALLLPFLIMMVGALLVLFIALGPLTDWLDQQLSATTPILVAAQWMQSMGLFSLAAIKAWLLPLMVAAVLLPLTGILGLAVAAVFVMPIVVRHVSRHHYSDLQLSGQHAFIVSLWNALWVSVLFMVGWVLTLPFWLFPPLGLLVSLLWWSFAFSRMMRLDAIVDHASAEERTELIARHGTGFWAIGLVCALLNLLPPAWVFLPVFSGLVYTHFGLAALRRLREERLALS
jgi:hypothetical protein